MEYKAKVVLADDVYRQIMWLTKNFDKEIGAVGSVKVKNDDGEKYFLVDKLFFPQQKVTGASVEVEPQDWIALYKAIPPKEKSNVRFYWHRHPGSSNHSHTDEEDTFGAFAAKERLKNYFLFLQTAYSGGAFNHEARIDIASPIRHTILDKDILVTKANTKEEDLIVKECQKIIETVIKKVEPVVWKAATTWEDKRTGNICNIGQNQLSRYANRGVGKDILSFNFTSHKQADIPDKCKASINFKDGQCTVVAGKWFDGFLKESIKKGILKPVVHRLRQNGVEVDLDTPASENFTTYSIQGFKKGYEELKDTMIETFQDYKEKAIRLIEKPADVDNFSEEEEGDEKISNTVFDITGSSLETDETVNTADYFVIKDETLAENVLVDLAHCFHCETVRPGLVDVYDFVATQKGRSDTQRYIGTIVEEEEGGIAIWGKDVIEEAVEIQNDILKYYNGMREFKEFSDEEMRGW